MTDIGHNSTAASEQLRLFIERVERLEEEKKGIAEDVKDVFSEAKGMGFDTKIMREIIRLRKLKPDDLRERNALIQTYAEALGLDLL